MRDIRQTHAGRRSVQPQATENVRMCASAGETRRKTTVARRSAGEQARLRSQDRHDRPTTGV
jgi:hypothetical protein